MSNRKNNKKIPQIGRQIASNQSVMSRASSSLSLNWSDVEDGSTSGSHEETVSQLTATNSSELTLRLSGARNAAISSRATRDGVTPSGIAATPPSNHPLLTSSPLNGMLLDTPCGREKTYDSFKRSGKLSERDRRLCDAGFYQVDKTDTAECHDCHVNINLTEIDRPDINGWILHIRSSPECRFVLQMKGGKFVNSYRYPSSLTPDSQHQHVQYLESKVECLQRQLSQSQDASQTRMDSLQSQLDSSLEIQRGTEAMAEGLRDEFVEHRTDNLRRMDSMQSLVDTSMEYQQDLRSMCSENSNRIDGLRSYVCDEVRQLNDNQQEFQQNISTDVHHMEEHLLPNNISVMESLQRQGSVEDEFLPTVLDGLEFDVETDDED